MDVGIRAIGFVVPFALHQLYRRLQPSDRSDLPVLGNLLPEQPTVASLLDEEEEEPDFGLPGPTCPCASAATVATRSSEHTCFFLCSARLCCDASSSVVPAACCRL